MFKRTTPDGEMFAFSFEGQRVSARPGDSIATALLAAGIVATRITPVSGAPRGPYCMMGACFECLAEVDGVGGVQTCLVEATPGMVVLRQQGAREMDEADAA